MSAQHVLRWVGAESFVAAPVSNAPGILRFDSDDFMDRLLGVLAEAPQTLPSFIAAPESWQALAPPTPAPVPEVPRSAPARALARSRALAGFRRNEVAVAPPAPSPLKLFQPVHQRFYLAAAHLVCELPGLPTRTTASGDKSGMLLRRVLADPDGKGRECAFVKAPGQPGRWVPLADAGQPLPGEDWLSVFPLAYTPPTGPARKMLAGLIPVARHDDYRFAGLGAAPAPAAGSRVDDLKALARMKVIAPWQGLIERARLARDAAAQAPGAKPWDGKTDAERAAIAAQLAAAANASLQAINDQLQEASWRLLQDMAEFFADVLPQLKQLPPGHTATRPALQDLRDLIDQAVWGPTQRAPLEATVLSPAVVNLGKTRDTLHKALTDIVPLSAALDATEQAFPAGGVWPGFSFPLVVATSSGDLPGPFQAWPAVAGQATADVQELAQRRLETLFEAIAAAIVEALGDGSAGEAVSQSSHAARLAAELEAALKADTGPPRYVLRFVHQRCDCGPLHPAVMSAPSEVFELAGFFDPEAPLRPIRIALPFDTSPGGLRKFGKNSAFIMSDLLCGQMKRVRRLGFGDLVLSVLPWPFHKDLSVPDSGPCGGSGASSFGTICSLSIPIITIVAFILLIVIATLLDLIFRWLPFLMVCFPVPGLKGKKP